MNLNIRNKNWGIETVLSKMLDQQTTDLVSLQFKGLLGPVLLARGHLIIMWCHRLKTQTKDQLDQAF